MQKRPEMLPQYSFQIDKIGAHPVLSTRILRLRTGKEEVKYRAFHRMSERFVERYLLDGAVQVVHLLQDVVVELLPVLGQDMLLLAHHVRQELLLAPARTTSNGTVIKDTRKAQHTWNQSGLLTFRFGAA